MDSFLHFFRNLSFSLTLWMLCWIIILLASFKRWEKYNWIFGFITFYIIFFPIYRRWDRYLNNVISIWPEIWICSVIIIFLIILWIILFIKVLPNILCFFIEKKYLNDTILENKIIKIFLSPYTNKQSKIKEWLENFSLIWSSWFDLFAQSNYSRSIFLFIIKNYTKYLNTKKRKLCFFGLTIFLPRILTLTALFYDIYIEQQLCWFPTVALLLTISVITKMSFSIVEKGSQKNFDLANSLLTLEPMERTEFSENEQKEIKETFSERAVIYKFGIIEEFKDQIDQEGYNRLVSDFHFYGDCVEWCNETNDLLENVSKYILLLFVTMQLFAQIKIFFKNYDRTMY